MYSSRTNQSTMQKQRGAAFIVMLVILIMGVVTFLVSSLNSSALQIKRDQVTADALAQARDALIGYAASVNLTAAGNRPGDLPCPDNYIPGSNNEGRSTTPCAGNALGRLPWKTLGLPDLRDGSGERLWYAVSNNFKNSPRTPTLNSDTAGTLSVFSSAGTLNYDGGSTGSSSTGAVAIIIAPGAVLTRQGSASAQDRSAVGNTTASNYLDIATVGGVTEDNGNFTDGSSTHGFIQGRIKDNNGNLIVNDQLIVITQDNIMQAIQKRVAGEVKQCLNEYASDYGGLYPWAAPTNPLAYTDTTNTWFGRIPDYPFNNTVAYNPAMHSSWGPNCTISYGTWWTNWKEMVFYGFSDAYSPNDNTGALLLTVNPPSATANKKFVVIVAGKTLAVQVRSAPTDKTILSNYLELPNSNGATSFAQGSPSSTFNDTIVFQ